MGNIHNKRRWFFVLLTTISLILTIIFFVFPPESISSGANNSNNSSRARMTKVFNLTNNNVMSFTFDNEEKTSIEGISLYLRLFENGTEINDYDLSESCELVYSVANEEGKTLFSNSIRLSELILPVSSSEKVENKFYFSSPEISSGDKLRLFFALKNTPDNVVVTFYGINYLEDEDRENLVLEHKTLTDKCVLIYRILVEGKDYSLALLLMLCTFILAEGIILNWYGENNVKRES